MPPLALLTNIDVMQLTKEQHEKLQQEGRHVGIVVGDWRTLNMGVSLDTNERRVYADSVEGLVQQVYRVASERRARVRRHV